MEGARAVERSYVPAREAPGEARRFVRETLFAWGQRVLLEPAQLLVSELVTNAVVHGSGGEVTLRLHRMDGCLRIEVLDGNGTQMPRLSPPRAEGARGLHIVDAVSSGWGYAPSDGGKTVWCELDLDSGLDPEGAAPG